MAISNAVSLANLSSKDILIVDSTNDRVGIASTTPTQALDVVGTIKATSGTFTSNVSVGGTLSYEDVTNIDSVGIITARSDVSIADKIIHTGDTNTAIRFPAADTFTVETAGSERLRIKSDGKFGFNTTNPPRDYCFMSGQADTNIQITNSTTGVDDSAGALIQQDGNDLYIWNKENSFMSLGTNATEKVRITSAGEVRIANGNLKFTTAGKGIDFSATGDGTGTATSELLDDYEEGTFTPTAFVGTTALSVSGNTGTYTKVGNTVFFSCRLDSITKSGTGAFSIGGLPYTPLFSGNANKYNQPTVRFTGINPGGVLVPLFSPTGSQFIFFQSISTSGGLGNVTNTNLNSTCSIYGLSGFYTV